MKCALGPSSHAGSFHPSSPSLTAVISHSTSLALHRGNEMREVRAVIHNYFIHGKMYRKQQTIQIYRSFPGVRFSSSIVPHFPKALCTTRNPSASRCASCRTNFPASHPTAHHSDACHSSSGLKGRNASSERCSLLTVHGVADLWEIQDKIQYKYSK